VLGAGGGPPDVGEAFDGIYQDRAHERALTVAGDVEHIR